MALKEKLSFIAGEEKPDLAKTIVKQLVFVDVCKDHYGICCLGVVQGTRSLRLSKKLSPAWTQIYGGAQPVCFGTKRLRSHIREHVWTKSTLCSYVHRHLLAFFSALLDGGRGNLRKLKTVMV